MTRALYLALWYWRIFKSVRTKMELVEARHVADMLGLSDFVLYYGLIAFSIIFMNKFTTLLLVGLTLNLAVNVLLKKCFNQDRPPGAKNCDAIPTCDKHQADKGQGMPSGHSQTLGFLVGSLSLWLLKYGSKNTKFLSVLILVALKLAVMIARVYSGCHTVSQVTVGSVIGLTLGCAWFYLVLIHFPKPK